MKREDVYKLIDLERDYQNTRWGGKSHDEKHELGSWLIYMEYYLNKAKAECTTTTEWTEALRQVLKLTTLGVACLEYLDDLSSEDVVFGNNLETTEGN